MRCDAFCQCFVLFNAQAAALLQMVSVKIDCMFYDLLTSNWILFLVLCKHQFLQFKEFSFISRCACSIKGFEISRTMHLCWIHMNVMLCIKALTKRFDHASVVQPKVKNFKINYWYWICQFKGNALKCFTFIVCHILNTNAHSDKMQSVSYWCMLQNTTRWYIWWIEYCHLSPITKDCVCFIMCHIKTECTTF